MNVEELLRDGLQREADRTEYEPTPVEQIAWRARQVRRTQWVKRGGVALAATAAVSAPVALYGGALVAGPDPDRGEPDRSLLAALPQGGAPAVDWLEGSTYHGRSGYEAPVAVEDVATFIPYRGGLLLTTPTRVVVLDDTGEVVSDRCGSPSIGQDEAGETAVTGVMYFECSDTWEAGSLLWTSVTGSYDEPLATSNGRITEPVAIRGAETFFNFATLGGQPEGAFRLVTELGPPEEIPGIAEAADVTPDGRWLAGVTTDGRDVVADAATGEVRAELTGRPVAFSRDGTLVATVAGEGLQVHDAATGEVLAETGDRAGTVTPRVAWESPGQVLVVVEDDGEEAVVRLALDGTVTRATSPAAPGSFALVAQP